MPSLWKYWRAVSSDAVACMAPRNTSATTLTSRKDDHYFSEGHRLNRGASKVRLTSRLFGVACLIAQTNLISLFLGFRFGPYQVPGARRRDLFEFLI